MRMSGICDLKYRTFPVRLRKDPYERGVAVEHLKAQIRWDRTSPGPWQYLDSVGPLRTEAQFPQALRKHRIACQRDELPDSRGL